MRIAIDPDRVEAALGFVDPEVLLDCTLEPGRSLEESRRRRVVRRRLDQGVIGEGLRLHRGDRRGVVADRAVGVRHAVPAVLPDLVLEPVRVGSQVAQEPEVVVREPPEKPGDGRLERVAHGPLAPGNSRGRELRPALDRSRRSADEERRRVDGPVVGEPPQAVRLDVANLVRDAPRLLFPECVEFATLDAAEVEHRGFEQLREEVADDHRHGQ
jgi:hypothetical protein